MSNPTARNAAAEAAESGSEWARLTPAQAAGRLGTDLERGLDAAEAARRHHRQGPNRLAERAGRGGWHILWRQLRGPLIVLLAAAAAVSALLGELQDAAAVVAILGLNTLLGFIQDYRAERAMAALQRLTVPQVEVVRGGRVETVPAHRLVTGDVVVLSAGNGVPADARLIESAGLQVDEAALTGESEPVAKEAAVLGAEAPSLAERRNQVFMGTAVTGGRARVLVTAIGMDTELGRIAGLLQTVERAPTPLTRRLAQLARVLVLAAIVLVAAVVALGLWAGGDPRLMLLTGLGLAVAAVPEGLPAVATVALAVGARRLLARRALIRRLPAVETLGSVTVICTDKTGTLTQGRMTVAALELADGPLLLERSADTGRPAATWLLAAAALCNDAELETGGAPGSPPRALGDATEGALALAAAERGLVKTTLEQALPRAAERPFDAERMRMTTVHRFDPAALPPALAAAALPGAERSRYLAFTKGAAGSLLAAADRVWVGDRFERLEPATRRRLAAAEGQLAERGMRVLGVAMRLLEEDGPDRGRDETRLVWLGLAAVRDPIRPAARAAVARCRGAGVRPVMITGDHPRTALAIAHDVGIADPGAEAILGDRLAAMTRAELAAAIEGVSVFARVSPGHKLAIVEALQMRGHIVAMTGDGVNDAPALRRADIGVAMGTTGTDVAKEAAEMVLLDDDFETLVGAIEEGRTIYDNVRRFVAYTLTSNSGEIWVMALAPLVGMPLPLLPLQILWVNLVTDGLPGLALGLEPAEAGSMNRPPYPPRQPIVDREVAKTIGWLGLLMGLVTLGAGWLAWRAGADEASWRTVVFTVLTLTQMGNALGMRSFRESLVARGLASNRPLLAAIALTLALQLAIIYHPALQRIFHTAALPPVQLAGCLAVSSVALLAFEGFKRWRRYQR